MPAGKQQTVCDGQLSGVFAMIVFNMSMWTDPVAISEPFVQ
jgi:hypothetical protein